MSLREDIEKVEIKANNLEKSFAMEFIGDYKKANKRLFIIIMVILSMWFVTICAFVYYINTVDYEEITEKVYTSDGGNACIGDKCNNGEINYGNGYKKD